MVKTEALEKILSYISNNYADDDPLINSSYKIKRGSDPTTGFKIYQDKKITDFYALEIDPENKGKEIVSISYFDRLKYNAMGSKGREKLIFKLNKKYLKLKENELEKLVTQDQISSIEKKTNDLYFKVNQINHELNNANIYHEETFQNNPTIENPNSYNEQHFKNTKKNEYLEKRNDLLNDHYKKNPAKRLIISLKNVSTSDVMGYISDVSDKINKMYPNTELHFLNSLPIMALTGNPKEIEQIAKTLNNRRSRLNFGNLNNDLIRYAEFDQICFLPEIGSNYKQMRFNTKEVLWNLKNIGADIAQGITKGKGSKVGIIDTGIDYSHKELSQCFDPNNLGFNFIDNSNNPFDDHGHGTHVAGTVAGLDIGVAPEVQLFGLKVLDSQGYGYTYDVMAAVNWAIQNKLDVINLSLGSSAYLNAEQELYNEAFNSGLLTVASAGNSYNREYNYPASYQNVISVAAVDRNNNHADFSTYNDMVDIAAPGVGILSSIPNDQYAEYSGTSMSSPHVTGVASLIKSLDDLYPEEIEEILNNSSKYLGDEIYFGSGLVQAHDALNLIENLKIKTGGYNGRNK
jgi:subtilisin